MGIRIKCSDCGGVHQPGVCPGKRKGFNEIAREAIRNHPPKNKNVLFDAMKKRFDRKEWQREYMKAYLPAYRARKRAERKAK